MLEYPLLLLFPIAMVYAAASDVMTMTIPNRISVALAAGFLAIAVLGGFTMQQFLTHVATGAGVLVVGVIMFSRGWIGGGDAKLLAAGALWFGYEQLYDYVLLATIVGGALAVIIILYRQFVPPMWVSGQEWAVRLHDKSCGIPYGVALAGGALWLYPTSPIFTQFIT